ncbi:DGQHR domain-containing protein [Massilia sp. TS11]|uniref:DGQHR domain-containing protein n=1 Tax=Massilia sp. TS11 TaxID=2908003 RepID=UPI001EDB8F2A|nr:DGQHR domain-containing protein [Massilia sp. TS11]MCG2585969.1 DGQHR domain-containing protein [Massilia sp. TS11]
MRNSKFSKEISMPTKKPAPKSSSKGTNHAGKASTGHLKKTQASASSSKTKSAGKPPKTPKLRDIFEGAGFHHIPSDNVHFELQGRTGEIDHIFGWQNVILLCEETAGKDATKHCTNKIFFHKLIAQDWPAFFDIYRTKNPALDSYIGSNYNAGELEVRHIYYSEEIDVDDGVSNNSAPFKILNRAEGAYFSALVKTIARSAKFELLKYLEIALERVGETRISGGSVTSQSFPGFALPAAHTNYPKDFAIVSFYADPMALIQRAYVLRRDGWEDPDLSYQRFVRSDKLSEMREYLANNGKVFINNLIVTLPSKAIMRQTDGQVVDPRLLTQRTHVELDLPLELGTVGIIDGQHRILAYFEGQGAIEEKIAPLRKRQNLLVTGIIFPPNYAAEMRVKFEAELFLAINNTQTGVHTQLRQDLESIINPETPLAIGRVLINRLAREGSLEGMLQVSQFDPPEKVATGSIGPYVLKPLLRRGSAFYKTWDSNLVQDLSNPVHRQQYIEYALGEIKRLLVGCSSNLESRWKPVSQGGILSTTIVGGLLLLLERLAEAGHPISSLEYKKILGPLKAFNFSNYKSSGWAQMSKDLYSTLSL